jgi:hypothetical protein
MGGKQTMRTFLTRAVAGAAIAVTAAAGVVTAAGAASASTKTHTTLSVVANRSTIIAGQWDTIGGTLDAAGVPAPGQVVELDRYSVALKKFVPVSATPTNPAGAVKFAVRPFVTSKYELKFPGTATLAASHSGVVTIVVKPFVKIPTSLSIVAFPLTIKAGDATTISGVLKADKKPAVHEVIFLLRWNATTKKWDPVAWKVSGPKGGVSFVRKPSVTSKFELKFFGTAVLAGTHSGVVTVVVTPAS